MNYLVLLVQSKKTDYDRKITEIEEKLTDHNHDKYITNPKFNALADDLFNARLLAQANLITKTDFDAKLSGLNRTITSNKTKHLLVENELKKLKIFDACYFRGKNYFEEDAKQNYLVFQPMYKCFKQIAGDYISSRKCKGLSDKNITAPSATNNFLNPSLEYLGTKPRVRFSGSCLKQNAITYNHGNSVNIYIVYEINKTDNTTSSDPTLGNCLFGGVNMTKNADINKYKHSGYGIGFDRTGSFSFPVTGSGRNVIIFGVDMSSSKKIDNKKKDILIHGKGLSWTFSMN